MKLKLIIGSITTLAGIPIAIHCDLFGGLTVSFLGLAYLIYLFGKYIDGLFR